MFRITWALASVSKAKEIDIVDAAALARIDARPVCVNKVDLELGVMTQAFNFSERAVP